MAVARRRWVQTLPIPIDTAWDFFSDPRNLSRITPKSMNFVIVSAVPEKITKGLFIEYRVSPLFGIPLKWLTEITEVDEKKMFVDEQRKGPYKRWHHLHLFREVSGGVEMEDVLDYELKIPGLRRLMNNFIVGPQISAIFSYREKTLKEMFPG